MSDVSDGEDEVGILVTAKVSARDLPNYKRP
jgi:hypothetical protein